MVNVISLGAGKQSSYMLLRALQGEFEFKPDYAVFADTGCEPDYVYDYLHWLIKYVKDTYNFTITVVSSGNLQEDIEKYVDGKVKRVAMIPLYLDNGGIVNRQCTMDYKIRPVRKFLQSVRNGNRVRLWIGISLDEIERMKISPVKYVEHYYPLIKNRISIDEIINWYNVNKMREPGKSACLICPFHSMSYWTIFKKQFPSEFEKACVFDDKIRDYPNLRNKTFLNKMRKPLRDIDFSTQSSLFPEMIEECHGLCGL